MQVDSVSPASALSSEKEERPPAKDPLLLTAERRENIFLSVVERRMHEQGRWRSDPGDPGYAGTQSIATGVDARLGDYRADPAVVAERAQHQSGLALSISVPSAEARMDHLGMGSDRERPPGALLPDHPIGKEAARCRAEELGKTFSGGQWHPGHDTPRGGPETGRRARYYQITRSGKKQLDAEQKSWERLSQAVNGILGMTRPEEV